MSQKLFERKNHNFVLYFIQHTTLNYIYIIIKSEF